MLWVGLVSQGLKSSRGVLSYAGSRTARMLPDSKARSRGNPVSSRLPRQIGYLLQEQEQERRSSSSRRRRCSSSSSSSSQSGEGTSGDR